MAYPSHRNFDSYNHLENFLLGLRNYTHQPMTNQSLTLTPKPH